MKVRGGMLLARALQEKGVTRVFTLSGEFCNPALEGFMECGIAVINAPHQQVGSVTSAAWSPRFKRGVALAMLERGHWEAGTAVTVDCGEASRRTGFVTDLPMEER